MESEGEQDFSSPQQPPPQSTLDSQHLAGSKKTYRDDNQLMNHSGVKTPRESLLLHPDAAADGNHERRAVPAHRQTHKRPISILKSKKTQLGGASRFVRSNAHQWGQRFVNGESSDESEGRSPKRLQ